MPLYEYACPACGANFEKLVRRFGEAKARTILRRWKFDKDTIGEVAHLIRHHMFWYQTDWTGSAVRRCAEHVPPAPPCRTPSYPTC